MNTKKIVATVCAGAVFIVPVFAWAQIGLPNCGPNCGFNDLLALANRIIHFIVFDVTVPLIAIAFMVVGANLVLSQDKPGAWSSAKQQFEMIGYGIFWILAAFLLIKFVLYQFISSEYRGFLDFIFQQ